MMRLNMRLGATKPGDGNGPGPVLPAEIDFSGLANTDPYTPPAAWGPDFNPSGTGARIQDGLWQANSTQSISARDSLIDLNGQSDVFVECDDARAPTGSRVLAIMLFDRHEPGQWSRLESDMAATVNGYMASMGNGGAGTVAISRIVNGSESVLVSGSNNGTTAAQYRLEAEVVSGETKLRLYRNGVLALSHDDTHADRFTNFRTFGASVQNWFASRADLAALRGGVL